MGTVRKSSNELRTIFLRRDPPPGSDQRSWQNVREHALGEYWSRRLADRTELLSAEEVAELLLHLDLETAIGTLGDAARLNLLTRAQCRDLISNEELDRFPKSSWAKTEISLRLLLSRFAEEVRVDERRELLNELLHQRRYWPLESILSRLTGDELDLCERTLDDRSVLTRSAREQARQAIRLLRRGSQTQLE